MSILDKVKNISSSVLAFEKHPARELDMEQKIHYLNGLALVMNVDENIDEKEKEYLKILLNSFNLPVEQLDELIAFSQNPDDEAIQEMLKVLGEAGDIKYVFMLDCLTLAHYDGELHENEKELKKYYSNILKISREDVRLLTDIYYLTNKQDEKGLLEIFKKLTSFKPDLIEYFLNSNGLNSENIMKMKTDEEIAFEKRQNEILDSLNSRLEAGERIFVNQPYGKADKGDYIIIEDGKEQEAILYNLTINELSDAEKELEKSLWKKMENLQKEIDKAIDKMISSGELFANIAERKMDRLQEQYDVLSDERDEIISKHLSESISKIKSLTSNEVKDIFEYIVKISLQKD